MAKTEDNVSTPSSHGLSAAASQRSEGRKYPICPLCGCNTIVMYSPPREGLVGTDEGYRLYFEQNWAEYVDWNRAHLYCCNADTDCKIEMPIIGGLTTPVTEARYQVKLDEPRGLSASEQPCCEAVNNPVDPTPGERRDQ